MLPGKVLNVTDAVAIARRRIWLIVIPPVITFFAALLYSSTIPNMYESDMLIAIDPQRARSASLDYLALGDWHGTKQIGPATWYAGTPEPDSFTDNAPGNVLVVEIPGAGGPAHVETMPTGIYRWLARHILCKKTCGAGIQRCRNDHCIPELQLMGYSEFAGPPQDGGGR